MKKVIIIMAAFAALAGCKTTDDPGLDVGVAPVAQMPELPATLSERAERLPDIEDRTLGGIHRDGVNTDVAYNDLAIRYNAVVDAWGCVREALNTRSTVKLDKCFTEGLQN
jgi:hypothetical protein